MTARPFLPDWNFRTLQALFSLIPHRARRDSVAQFLVMNALASTWIYAAVFCVYWHIQDECTAWRRIRLAENVVAFCLAMIATLIIRPWVAWPAPNMVARFQSLYPDYLWNQGNQNCFPSHSTLVYLTVSAGFWPFRRSLSVVLMGLTLATISLPRVYIGGHYPIDVLAAIGIAGVSLWIAHRLCGRQNVQALLRKIVSKGVILEFLLFLWLFELADGFRSGFWIATILLHGVRTLAHEVPILHV
jgi:membrane-associated phospholipid phosphatase